MTSRPSQKHLGRHDIDLVTLTVMGDRSAYGELVRRHAASVRTLMRRMGADSARADDLAQDALILAFERISEFRGDGSFAGWLKRIAARLLLKQLRRDQGFISVAQVPEPEPDLRLSSQDADRLDLDQALARLSRVERVCVTLSYGAGLSHNEVSETLGVPLGTVKSHVRRGLEKLRDIMGVKVSNLAPVEDQAVIQTSERQGPIIGGVSHA